MCKQKQGFTLIEILMALAILSVLAVIAVPSYMEYVEKGKEAIAKADIVSIDAAIERFIVMNQDYPDSLAPISGQLDPWGNPYRYLKLNGVKGKGAVRKDKNLVPINSDYDLYSMGRDGKSQPPLTAKASRDDIVRANNGSYIGLASDY